MSPKHNAAEARRIAAAARAQDAQTPTLSPELEAQLANYEPDPKVTRGRWNEISHMHGEVMRRSHIFGTESFKRHCWIVAGYLSWRSEEGLSIGIAEAMTFTAIDDYYRRGLDGRTEATRNTYRSKLRNLASHVNPSLQAPPRAIPLGHQEVRPPYSRVEAAQIRRVSLRQRNAKTRQQLCMGVGLHGGCGVTPAEARAMTIAQVEAGDRGDPIWVNVEGKKPRRVPVRREYEELVRVGLDGAKPSDLVMGKEVDRRNILSGIVDRAENYDAPHIEARRLRSSWIATLMCERIPVNVILHAAGLSSARTLTELAGMLELATDLSELRGEDQ